MKDKQTAIRIAEESRSAADQYQLELVKANTELQLLRERNQSLTSDNEHLANTVATLESSLETARRELSDRESEVAQLKSECSTVKADLDQLQSQLKLQTTAMNEQTCRLVRLKDEHEALQSQTKSCQNKMQYYSDRLNSEIQRQASEYKHGILFPRGDHSSFSDLQIQAGRDTCKQRNNSTSAF